MAKLSVNVNKVATLRNARGNNLPDVVLAARKVIGFGGQGITVHPRPDGRHILWDDVVALKSVVTEELGLELNIEGYPSADFLERVLKIAPAQCTLVPDPPDVLTSNAGWRLAGNEGVLKTALEKLSTAGIRSSLFVDPANIEMKELIAFRDLGCDRIELYTEAYASTYVSSENPRADDDQELANATLASYQKCAGLAESMGLGVNAGHDLNLDNLSDFLTAVPQVQEVSIGHALVCDALDYGWQKTMELYCSCLDEDLMERIMPSQP